MGGCFSIKDDDGSTQKSPPPYSPRQASLPLVPPYDESGNHLDPISILDIPFEDVRDHYILVELVGKSRFGPTFLCTENSTGHHYACKVILKERLNEKSDRDAVRREVEIRQHLGGQPNIVGFRDVYEDKNAVFVVMELCSGRDPFDLIGAEGQHRQRTIVDIVNACIEPLTTPFLFKYLARTCILTLCNKG